MAFKKRYIESNPPVRIFKYIFSPLRRGSNLKNVILTSRGRDSIQLACNYLNVGPEDVALVPAFTCDTVTGILVSNCKLTYYDISEVFKIDVTEIERLISENPMIKILYVIHYFGFLHKNMEELNSVCKSNGITLIEDHAHSALTQGKNSLSDIQIFSFRKIFPTADGGGMLIHGEEFNHSFNLKSKITANLKGFMIAFKRIGSLYSSTFRRYIGGVIQKDISNLNEGSSRINPLPVSIFGKGIIRSADLQKNASERREQFKLWENLIEETPFEPLLPGLEEGTVPVGFPIKVGNNTEVAEYFKKFNIFLKIHWTLLPEGTAETCPVSLKISRSSITLPIYPGLIEQDMKFIRDELLKCAVPV